ncbi:MAG TPA: Uma2 family endonuclease [Leptolyngbya sp.]|nr:Uma2 family endonuclease [Leptolyngbya sp.]
MDVYKTEHHPYPENIFWLIEYSNSSLQKDLEIKSKVYASADILEYWVINLITRELLFFVIRSMESIDRKSHSRLARFAPNLFADIEIEVERLIR